MGIALALLIVAAPAKPADYGAIEFRITGNAECKKHFERGMLQLHSFEYERAHGSFAAAAKADAGCAMAHWGDAMAYHHPLWGEEWEKAAHDALARITNEASLTPSERAHIRAARALWGPGDEWQRLNAWLDETQRNVRELPGDDEIALQYSLALIANSERYTNIRRLMQATAIAMDVLDRRPTHPGAAHYFIHACDTPDHAVLALPAARVYARIAPTAEHARHMPSHIFVQLGMWKEAAAANEDAWGAALARLAADEKDKPGFHAYSWLGAAYLELGRAGDARKILDDMRTRMQVEDSSQARNDYSNLARKYVTDTGRYNEADEIFAVMRTPLRESGESNDSLGCAMHLPGSPATRIPSGLIARSRMLVTLAEGAVYAGDETRTRALLAEHAKTIAAMKGWATMLPANLDKRTALMDAAFTAAAHAFSAKSGDNWKAAIDAARAWADINDEHAILGPAFDPPALLFVADLQTAAGRHGDALKSYDNVRARIANHSRAMLGAARALKIAGKDGPARERYAAIASQWSDPRADRDGVAEARGTTKPLRN